MNQPTLDRKRAVAAYADLRTQGRMRADRRWRDWQERARSCARPWSALAAAAGAVCMLGKALWALIAR